MTEAPKAPLWPVFEVVDRWWEDTVSPRFYATFARRDDDRPDNMNEPVYHNPEARLLLVVARDLDPRYNGRQIHSLWDDYRKKHRKRRYK